MSTRTHMHQAEAAGFEAVGVDLDNVAAGQTFQAKWGFKNTGSTTWDDKYQLVYTEAHHPETANVPRSPLGTQTVQPLGQLSNIRSVKPGETLWVTLRFTAPSGDGTFATNWQLRAPNGVQFGPVRWMRLVVPKSTGASLAYRMVDFSNSVANFNSMQPGQQFTATWTLQNMGTAVWSGDFQIGYLATGVPDTQTRTATPMGAPATITLRELTKREQVKPGELVEIAMRLTAPTTAGAYAFHWQLRDGQGNAFGDIRWLAIGVGRQLPTEIPIKPSSDQEVGFGMNVNINDGHPLDAERMNGLGWVRFVFWASRLQKTPEQAYQERYRHIIQTYANQGIRSLIILHQDTFWGNAPWDNGGWGAYAQRFGEACGRVARVCAEFGDMVAYQIHNEQDSEFGNDKGNKNHSAIGIAPANYAKVLQQASAAIRQAHPGAPVILGGLKTGPGNAIEYVRQVQQALGGKLPVDALAYHPYGRYVKLALFNYATIGKLGDALDMFKRAYPNIPLWITEVGAAADIHIGSEHYANIATYMREFVNEIANNYNDYVQALIWFGWTDIMRNSGILTADNKPKAHVFDAFVAMRDRYKGLAKSVDLFTEVSEATFESFSSTQANLDAVPAGASFTCRWTFKNSGTTAWDKNYTLVYVPRGSNPDPMIAKQRIPVTEAGDFTQLEPDETAVFTLNLTAPERDGRIYRSFWQIQDPQGNAFAHFYVDITVVPAPPVGTSARTPDMTFLADHTIPDYEKIVAGTDFNKQWRVKNSGSRQWGDGFHLAYVDGNFEMARSNASHVVPVAKPGDEVILTVPMTAPQSKTGEIYSVWRLKDDRGNFFGDPLWAKIVVTGSLPAAGAASTPLSRLLADQTMWYSQVDPRWRNDQLGFGREKIGTWGCLMTCMAMALSAYGTRLTPQEMNQRLKNMPANQGGFSANSSVTPFLAPAYLGGLQYNKNVKSWPNKQVDWAVWTGENPISRIDKALAKGHIVVAQVDTRLNTAFVDQHWVVIVKRSGDDYQMIDPLTPPTAVNRITSLKARYMNHIPSQSAETNLRNAIISTMVYTKPSGSGN
ncbi:NBR1-Ig-like domain-containing protein [Candidatus Leptofilum sp.]|uniref:NBR1-Ig-like domain-containing protein n=1 Tax=Candidatus Leptofilum sp. TaxID=3241576 RepID=UPI003B5C6CBD